MDYSSIIKERRKSVGITQEDLADMAGISLSYLKMIEQRKANPTIQIIEQVLDCLGMQLNVAIKQPHLNQE
ncbi:MAG: helix-turn-helix domain-containing protein [Bacteroidales bacterium]|nr:helix-turn-helix domain-containing protein [Bacteroidales bacterium]